MTDNEDDPDILGLVDWQGLILLVGLMTGAYQQRIG
ncbi:hypothetical protein sync_2418 [Synechococcus sp. CC9311]|nr:hypothetical protein sync_2418 [Synechococcus sp. CC9311]